MDHPSTGGAGLELDPATDREINLGTVCRNSDLKFLEGLLPLKGSGLSETHDAYATCFP
jgi:hypothetical protein